MAAICLIRQRKEKECIYLSYIFITIIIYYVKVGTLSVNLNELVDKSLFTLQKYVHKKSSIYSCMTNSCQEFTTEKLLFSVRNIIKRHDQFFSNSI